MNLDYVRRAVLDRDIDVPSARGTLVLQAAMDMRALALRPDGDPDLRTCMRWLYEEPDARRIQAVVDVLAQVLTASVYAAQAFPLPGSHLSPLMAPGPDNALMVVHQHMSTAAQLAKVLDILSWVLAYDELIEESSSSAS